jgi:CubicO group peptidase (beta-lactamase class C family)
MHTSCVPNYEKLTADPLNAYRQPLTLDVFLERFCSKSIQAGPGTQFNHNNADYILLSKFIKRGSGKSWEQSLQERLIRPLQMRDTGPLKSQQVVERLARGYSVDSAGSGNKRSAVS